MYDTLQEPIVDPVIAMDGSTYERMAIRGWLAAQHGGPLRSPVTQETMPSAMLLPNLAFRSLIKIASELQLP